MGVGPQGGLTGADGDVFGWPAPPGRSAWGGGGGVCEVWTYTLEGVRCCSCNADAGAREPGILFVSCFRLVLGALLKYRLAL
jgi:hypothetical protein